MILGIGIDLIEVPRIRTLLEKSGERFMRRILLDAEIQYCRSHRDPAPFVAARFAAKEAISKAFGTGICAKLSWLDMEVRKMNSGQPFAVLHGKGLSLMQECGAHKILISLTHTREHASAVAILEA